MAIITFINNNKEQTGKTLSLAAIVTYMSIEHNSKNLIVSTADKEDRLKKCFWQEKRKSKFNFGIFGPNTTNILEQENGIIGLAKMCKSNKINPNIITNYTKIVFKDRLEVLLGAEQKGRIDVDETYPDIITIANQYYDRIFIDLDDNIDKNIQDAILKKSDVIVVSLSQRLTSIDKIKEEKEKNEILKSPKTLLLIGRFDKYSKYNVKNITRYLGEKNQILTIPYNTLFFEASEEAKVPDLFLKFKKSIDQEDRNAFFIEEIKRASENIIYRQQMVQASL